MKASYTYIPVGGGGVRCMDCRHERPVASAPWLSRCTAGEKAGGAAGTWRSDRIHCKTFEANPSERILDR